MPAQAQPNRHRIKWLAAGLAVLVAGTIGLDLTDKAFPPPMQSLAQHSVEVSDRHGALLRVFANEEGRWRLRTRAGEVDPTLSRMIITYEDKRFHRHAGVDPLAMIRAGWQWLRHGRIVSGGSTLTMQLARLMEPRAERSIPAKLRQMMRALQLERRLNKTEILSHYLTLAPYGGNLEGVRAASLAYFGREPSRLSTEEAALLVALPQRPEHRRPDRYHDNAMAARNRVLVRLTDDGIIPASTLGVLTARAVPKRRQPLPALAAHLSDRVRNAHPVKMHHQLRIDRDVQARLERVAVNAAGRHGPKQGVAMMAVDLASGDVIAHIGAADFTDHARAGWLDMTQVPRSPGSALKPFIYGLVFAEGLALPETIISDRPADFAGYRPENFDSAYRGDVTVRSALQLSLNVPAVRLLDAVGPQRLATLLERSGLSPRFPDGKGAGLAMGLGGVGVTLDDLVAAYAMLARHGQLLPLRHSRADAERQAPANPVLSANAAWLVADILAGAARPADAATGATIAYKTGTSYGFRDAWAIGFDGATVIGVWTGRADNAPLPGMTGLNAAAPILFEAFAHSGREIAPIRPPPKGTVRLSRADLPPTMRRFVGDGLPVSTPSSAEQQPSILYPVGGSSVEMSASTVLPLKLQGGRPPFRWLANGAPLTGVARTRRHQWAPEGPGYATLTVIDAIGRSDSVSVFIEGQAN
ncbi:MAG: penicillin-binding protein 1C [Pseudomonadota bacterium]